jgi:aminoglycoside phosphotransferase (APT) family kinase protein
MSSEPTERALAWAAERLSATAITAVTGLHGHGGGSPWILDYRRGDQPGRAVLRVADWDRIWGPAINRAAAGLEVVAAHELPTARLIALDAHGGMVGEPALLETYCGATAAPSCAAMPSAGAALAQLHAIHLTPTEMLPVVRHHTPEDDHPATRRWARRFQSASSVERERVLTDYICGHPGLSVERAVDRLTNTATSDLLARADDRVSALPAHDGDRFLHGDVWFGNMLWENELCRGLIDWKSSGVGSPGVDLGSLRMRATFAFSSSAADEVTAAWEDAMKCRYDNVAYWDVVAALHTPYGEETDARDAFLEDAMARLG